MKAIWTLQEIKNITESLLCAADDMEFILNGNGKLDEDHESYWDHEERLVTFCTAADFRDGLGERGELGEDEEGCKIYTGSEQDLLDVFELFKDQALEESEVDIEIEIRA